MTTFEITITTLLVAIVLLLMWVIVLTRNNYRLNQTKELKRQQQFKLLFGKVGSMELLAIDIRKILKDLMDTNSQEFCWNELTQEQQSEFIYRLTHPVVESPFKPPFNPTCETTNKEE